MRQHFRRFIEASASFAST